MFKRELRHQAFYL